MADRPNDLGRYEHNVDCPGDELGWAYVPSRGDRETCRGCFSQGLVEQTRRSAYVAAADAFLQYLTDSFEGLLAEVEVTVTGQRCLLVIAHELLTQKRAGRR
ncbi:hypothetical protein [Nocardioides caldifontis]|uniref:hypothetical protein n=1 Tax=Nocardioides caldifontis TaxID=2588938 RepID=UPI0011DFDD5A|nr:hypothetical protein [Nocardioides caldifontis]